MKDRRVGDKIRTLEREGTPRRQAVAESLSMEREGRLAKGGRYIRMSKRTKARRARRRRS
jgi:hypothetical protein